jgi:hypothetical protein
MATVKDRKFVRREALGRKGRRAGKKARVVSRRRGTNRHPK